MTWHDVLFAHWPIAERTIRDHVPRALEIERFDGSAWLGVIPFSMTTRPRGVPCLLRSRFTEVNVRTYVRHKGKSGVWFFSLDASHRLTVWGARRFFHLPYHFAAMSSTQSGGGLLYYSRRKSDSGVHLDCRYRAINEPQAPANGTREEWLTERYCLFSVNRRGDVFSGEIHHPPWLLQSAQAEIRANTMAKPMGLALPSEAPVLHFAKCQDVLAWAITAQK